MSEGFEEVCEFLRDNNVFGDIGVHCRATLLTNIKVLKNGKVVNRGEYSVIFEENDVFGTYIISFDDPQNPNNNRVLNTKYQTFNSDYCEMTYENEDELLIRANQDGDEIVVHINGTRI